MHELVMRIKEPELCYVFARNANRRGHPELARQVHPDCFGKAAA